MNIEIGNAFRTPLAVAKLSENEQHTLEEFYEEYIPRELDIRGNFEQYTTYFESVDKVPLANILGEAIKDASIAFMKELYNEVPATCSIRIWLQDYGKGHYHSAHMHPDVLASGIYVLRSNNTGGPLVLRNPDNTCAFKAPKKRCNIECCLPPVKGNMYIFPPWVIHDVPGSAIENVERTVIAFNIF